MSAAPRRTGRSVLAVLAGFVVIFVLSLGTDGILHASGVYPPWGQSMSNSLFGLATAYRIVYGVFGCWVTARLAPNAPMKHAMILGVIGLVFSLAGLVFAQKQGPEFGPLWYALAIVAIALPCAWAGGRIRESQLAVRRLEPERNEEGVLADPLGNKPVASSEAGY